MKSREFKYSDARSYRLPDHVHFICIDCAELKHAQRRDNHVLMRTMCDMCEETRPDVSLASDYMFGEYAAGEIRIRKWKKIERDTNIERSDE